MKLGMFRWVLVVSAIAILVVPARRLAAQASERPGQVVATSTAARDLVNASHPGTCVAIQAAPGTGNMLAADYTVPRGVRELLLSADFQNATTVSVRTNSVNMVLLSGATFGADQLTGPVAIPVEEGQTVNFRLGTGNDGAATRMFKVEAVASW